MESLLLRALESTLRHWLKSFSRDQFKLRGRSVQLSELDLNGDVLHAAIGLPPTLEVTEARVGKLELTIPSLSNVNREPIVVAIDRLELVLTETPHDQASSSPRFQFQLRLRGALVMGMRIRWHDHPRDNSQLNAGNSWWHEQHRGGAAWKPPLASLTMRNLQLYTTNEHWKVVPLNQARDFNSRMKSIYVFKKLEWESLLVDLLPHPDMFTDEQFLQMGRNNSRDKDGAKRLFFGGERFLDSVSGSANITMSRSEQNSNLGLEVQLHIPDILVPALSEPGLRALLRFMTGVYVCMNRGDVGVKPAKSEAAGKSIIEVRIEHVFLCIKDTEFQVEFLLQALQYVRASTADGACMRTMSRIIIGCLFLRDTFSQPSCTLVQPSMRNSESATSPYVPSFASDKLWPRIYPLEEPALRPETTDTAMVCLYSVKIAPAPTPPNLASQTVAQCQPLKINLQEDTCLRIASFLSDGINVEPGLVLPEKSLNAMHFSLKEFDLTVPLNAALLEEDCTEEDSGFTGARLHVEGFAVAQSPFLNFKLLNLEKDAACFTMWKGQPVDSSQQRWVLRAAHLSLALETSGCDDTSQTETAGDWAAGLWRCVEMNEPYLEAAMATADGGALIDVPPPGGIVRLGIVCKKYVSNTSSGQFLFVLKMYTYLGIVSDMLLRELKPVTLRKKSLKVQTSTGPFQNLTRVESLKDIADLVPSDMAVFLSLKCLELKLLESVPGEVATEGPPLVQIFSRDIDLTATHQTLAAAAVISSNLRWRDIRVDCVETELLLPGSLESRYDSPVTPAHLSGVRESMNSSTSGSPWNSSVQYRTSCGDSLVRPIPLKLSPLAGRPASSASQTGLPDMRGVFWIGEERGSMAPSGIVSSVERLPFLDVSIKNVIPFQELDAECHSLRIVAKIGGVRLGGAMAYNEALLHRFGVFDTDGGPGPEVEKVIKRLSKGSLANLFRPSSGIGAGRKGDEGEKAVLQEPTWDVGLPDNVEFEVHLLDWLFALEGADGVSEPERSPVCRIPHSFREDRCWHSTFRCLSLKAHGTKEAGIRRAGRWGTKASPVQSLAVQIEGLQALKPRFRINHAVREVSDSAQLSSSMEYLDCEGLDLSPADYGQNGARVAAEIDALNDHSRLDGNRSEDSSHPGSFFPVDPSVTSKSGFDFEIQLEEPEDDDGFDIGMGGWVVKICRAAVREPMEVEATRHEIEYMIELFKSEIESASRIAAGGLKLLQLHETIGHSAIEQLTHFGSGGLDRVLTPERDKSQRFSDGSVSSLPSFRKSFKKESTVTKLEASISETEALCWKLLQQQHLGANSALAAGLKALVDQIKSSQALLGHLQKDL